MPAALLSLALVVLAGLTAAAPARAAGMAGVFTVSDIAVEADGKTATRAREAARAAGQQEALTELLHRLTAQSDWPRLPQPDSASITDLVLSFQVQKEHLRPTHYTGTYTFHFDATDIRNLLNGAHITFSELASKPVVLIPLLQNATGAHLWDDPNPWRDAWNNANGRAGLVPWIVPLGDIDDVEIFDTAQAQHPASKDVAALSNKYDNGDPVVVQAVETDTPDNATLAITVTRYSAEGVLTGTTSVTAPKANPAFYTAGVVASRQLMEAHWKQIVATAAAGPGQPPPLVTDQGATSPGGTPPMPGAPATGSPGSTGAAPVGSSALAPLPGEPASPSAGIAPSGGPSTIEVAVPIANLGEWSRINDKLSHVDGIVEQDIVMMTNDEVLLSLKLSADPTTLGLAFAQEDLVLAPENGAYTLRLDAGAAARLVPSELSGPPASQSPRPAPLLPAPAPPAAMPAPVPPPAAAAPPAPSDDNGPAPSPSQLLVPPPGANSAQ